MILAIESSCDDSSVALLDIKSLSLIHHKKISQESQHALYGGVVPELAARLHTAALPALLTEIKPYFKDIKAIAVTNEPGLSVSLINGVSMAKSLSVALNLPLIAINHLIGHIYSLFLEREAEFPLGILLVSGGHTMILDITKFGKISLIASTSDDSFGESFDKVAKMLGLSYPGGALVQNFALKCENKERFIFSIPLLHDKRLEYSFSGLKNQVRLTIENIKNTKNLEQSHLNLAPNLNENLAPQALLDSDISDICYAFENAACTHIMDKLKKVFMLKKWRKFGVVGGASANLNLRSRLKELCGDFKCELLLAPLEFCSDNAAMIARAGREKYLNKDFTHHSKLNINPKAKFD